MNIDKEYKNILYDGKKTYYVIYKDGTVKNIKTGHIMIHNLNSNGYPMVRLSFEKYKRTEVMIHKLLAVYFIPNPENKEEVHHKDKNILNFDLENLMWVTKDEHKNIHANDYGHPYAKCEKHPNSKLTDEMVHEICKILEDSLMTQREIAKKYNVDESIIHEIRLGNNWKEISSQYNIDKYNNFGWKPTSEDIVRNICKQLENNKMTIKQIAEYNNVKPEVVQSIFRGRSYKLISKEYDFTKNTILRPYGYNIKNDVLKLIKEGKSNDEIINILNIKRCSHTNTFLYRCRKSIA